MTCKRNGVAVKITRRQNFFLPSPIYSSSRSTVSKNVKTTYVLDAVLKDVKFLPANVFNHREFIKLLRETVIQYVIIIKPDY